MRLRVVHRTTYRYTDPASTSHHQAWLIPRQSENQRLLSFDLDVTPHPSVRRSRLDYFGNKMTYFSLTEPHHRLDVVATSLVDVCPVVLPDFSRTTPWNDVARQLTEDHRRDVLQAIQMRLPSPRITPSRDLFEYGKPSFDDGRPLFECVADLMQRIHHEFTYDPMATDLTTPLQVVLAQRRGVCQDFTHLMIGCLRSLGLAARYVSGYLRTHPPEGQPRLVGADASHAWVSVWHPAHGWADFDPTNNLCPSDEHVTVAHGRDFSDVTPVRGVILGGANHGLDVAVDVEAMGTTVT